MNSLRRCVVLSCLISLAASAAAGEPYWNQFRGSDGTGHSDEKGIPITFGEKENVVWKTALDGKAWSSPVIWGRHVWLTNAPADGHSMYAVCVDLQSGKILHNVLVFENAKPQYCHPLNSYATPTPVVEKDRVYVHYGSHGTACLDTKTAKVLWSRRDLQCDHFRGPASSPIVYGRLLYIHFDGFDRQFVVALDKQTGATVWQKRRAFDYGTDNGDLKKAYCTPTVIEHAGRKQLICPAAVATESRDPQSGRLLWTVRHGGMNASARPQFADGLLFLTNGMGGMVAVRAGGTGDATDSAVAWRGRKAIPKKSTPLVVGKLLFMMSDDGVASCVAASDGTPVWTHRIGGDFAASPICVDRRIYFFSQGGEIPVIAASRDFRLLATNRLDSGFMASPAVADGALVLRTKTHLYKVAASERR